MDAIICHHMPLDANLATFLGGPLMWSLPPRYWLSLFCWRRCKQKVRPVVCADRQANRSVTMQRNQEGWRQIDIGYEGSLQSCQTYLHLESRFCITDSKFPTSIAKWMKRESAMVSPISPPLLGNGTLCIWVAAKRQVREHSKTHSKWTWHTPATGWCHCNLTCKPSGIWWFPLPPTRHTLIFI